MVDADGRNRNGGENFDSRTFRAGMLMHAECVSRITKQVSMLYGGHYGHSPNDATLDHRYTSPQ